MVLADELAKKQRSISVAEFFEKNKHMLGFDSPTRGIITTVKEAIDNSLDACEEAQVLPDILVSVRRIKEDVFRVVVEDNGPGVSEENQDKLFTPNFTTKSSGTGLGLAICRNIIEKCEGEISYQRSFTLGGASFTVTLPKYQA